MTIIARFSDYLYTIGLITYPSDRFSSNISAILDVAADIYADLGSIVVPGTPNPLWSINWYLRLITHGTLSNPSKYNGAYSRIDYGVVDFSFRGEAIDGSYWNYSVQRFTKRTCRLDDRGRTFPDSSDYDAPGIIASPTFTSTQFGYSEITLASECAVKPISADIATMQAQVYYLGFLSNVDVDYQILL